MRSTSNASRCTTPASRRSASHSSEGPWLPGRPPGGGAAARTTAQVSEGVCPSGGVPTQTTRGRRHVVYDPDQKTIAAYARQSPHNLRQVGLFVQATINQHFEVVPQIMESFRLDGRDSKFLSHQKRRSFDALTSERNACLMTSWLTIRSRATGSRCC